VTGSAGRNKVENSSATATEVDDKGEQPVLFSGMQDTHPALVSGRGARVVVHSQDTMPHPTAEGFDVPAEFSVTIGVSARENVRVSQPHGNCTRDDRPSTESTEYTSPQSKYRSVSAQTTRSLVGPGNGYPMATNVVVRVVGVAVVIRFSKFEDFFIS